MEIYAVAVSARDLPRAVAFYEGLGFEFASFEPGDPHLEAMTESGVRLMIDVAVLRSGISRAAARRSGGRARGRAR